MPRRMQATTLLAVGALFGFGSVAMSQTPTATVAAGVLRGAVAEAQRDGGRDAPRSGKGGPVRGALRACA